MMASLLPESACSAQTAPASAPTSTPRRPNVILLLTDDQGYGDIHSHGNDKIDTPNLDRLAAAGARFDRFYVNPLCAPTRASLLTGRYCERMGVTGVCQGAETMRLNEVTVAQVLRAAGYATGIFGKWHNGEVYPYTPAGKGFDEFLGFCGGGLSNYFDVTMDSNGAAAPTKGYIADVLSDAAMAFVEKNRDRRFFCYVAYNTPHNPVQLPDRYFTKYKNRGLDDHTAGVYGMVENIDDNVARLLKRLDDLKLADDTIVIFLTDNGPQTPRFNAGMRGKKGNSDEGGIRVPCFVRWPGHIRPGTVIQPMAAHIDLLPTIAEFCGVTNPRTLPLDGRSLAGLLTGARQEWPDRKLFVKGAIRTQRWLLVRSDKGDSLYDMAIRAAAQVDVSADHPEVARELAAAHRAWRDETRRESPEAPPPLPVGHEAAPRVRLRTHLAEVKGVARQTPWTNGYLKPWSSTDASVTWKLDVVAAGRYEVRLLYVCAQEDLGAKVKVEACGRSFTATVDRPADPAPVKTPDRVPRTEADVRNWATLPLGALELDRGYATLRLSVPELPGKQAFEMVGVELDRKS